ncbi:hypothetical protein [Paraburkholderia sp. Ac-20336]|nr:hypothetical protein [Paraburkholderia sp. Ac-20336]
MALAVIQTFVQALIQTGTQRAARVNSHARSRHVEIPRVIVPHLA